MKQFSIFSLNKCPVCQQIVDLSDGCLLGSYDVVPVMVDGSLHKRVLNYVCNKKCKEDFEKKEFLSLFEFPPGSGNYHC